MPDLDGYAFCQTLEGMGAPSNQLPVVFVTSVDSHALDLLGNQMGAYVRKPVVKEKLLQAIQQAFCKPIALVR